MWHFFNFFVCKRLNLYPKPASFGFNSLTRCYRFMWSVLLVQADLLPFDTLKGIIVTGEHKNDKSLPLQTHLPEKTPCCCRYWLTFTSPEREMRDRGWWRGGVKNSNTLSGFSLFKIIVSTTPPPPKKKDLMYVCICVFVLSLNKGSCRKRLDSKTEA